MRSSRLPRCQGWCGVGDFAGGKATQRAEARQSCDVKLVSLPLLAVFLAALYVPLPPASLVWGALGGAAGVVGMQLFYRALSAGAMTVVAPITAVTSAAIPVVVGLVAGERTEGLRLVGVGCALAAIALNALPATTGHQPIVSPRRRGSLGGCFALFFILIAAKRWMRQAATQACGRSRRPSSARPGRRRVARTTRLAPRVPRAFSTFVAGPFDMTANALFLQPPARLSLVAPLAALYRDHRAPGPVVDHERLCGSRLLTSSPPLGSTCQYLDCSDVATQP